MPIALRQLRAAARRSILETAGTLDEAERLGLRTAFLCHSHHDVELVEGLVNLLAEQGLDLYVDWRDHTLPPRPDRRTAAAIRRRILDADLFLFLATPRSRRSRWCPWEIGYADAVKGRDEMFVIPTVDDEGVNRGNEYLDLYRKIDWAKGGDVRAWRPGVRAGVQLAAL